MFQISNFKFQIPCKRLGFTLVEIIIVLGIVGIIISAILPLFLNVITAGKSANYYSSAYKIADSKIEEYRNTSFDLLTSEDITISELPNGQIETIITNEIDGANEADIRRVELTIEWTFKKTQEIKIVTYIYRSGL